MNFQNLKKFFGNFFLMVIYSPSKLTMEVCIGKIAKINCNAIFDDCDFFSSFVAELKVHPNSFQSRILTSISWLALQNGS